MNAQDKLYSQFWNEFAFARPLSEKWALEFNLGQTWTSTPSNKSMFASNAQLYVRTWAHYYLNAKWKFSFFYAYYYNQYLPEIEQKELPELRSAFQAIWYLHRGRYTLNTRFRIEDRHMKTEEDKFEAFYRLRAQLKMLYPINARRIRQGVVYAIGSEEIFFKNNSQVAGNRNIDRFRLTLGAGYAVTDDLQLELTYANEFLPRDEENEVYNALQLNVGLNNFFPNLTKRLSKRKREQESLNIE